jgi:hypothetical protein
MADEIKFTNEELEKINAQVEAANKIVIDFGQIKTQILIAKQQLEKLYVAEHELEQTYKDLQTAEQSIIDELTKKYGVGTLDIQSGVFRPSAV